MAEDIVQYCLRVLRRVGEKVGHAHSWRQAIRIAPLDHAEASSGKRASVISLVRLNHPLCTQNLQSTNHKSHSTNSYIQVWEPKLKPIHKLMIAAACFALTSPAFAADLVVMSPALPVDDAAFDWTGFYAGVGVKGSSLSNGVVTDTTGYINLEIGANVQIESFVLGIEGWVGRYSVNTGASGTVGGIEGRAGYLVTDDVLLYGSVGAVAYDAGARYGTIGAGVEFAVTDSLSFDLDYEYWGWSNNSFTGHAIGASALWHF